jgi:nucleoside-diphosphate-sugar epimerase
VVRLPLGLLVRGSEVARRLRMLDFGADRSIMLNGPLALDPARAAAELGWRAQQGSAQVLREFLAQPKR